MELSNVEKTTINLPFITADKTGPKHIQQDLTREKFEILCKDLIDRCRIPVEKSLKDAKLDKSGIDEVVLVGGSTRIPAIQQLVESLTGKVNLGVGAAGDCTGPGSGWMDYGGEEGYKEEGLRSLFDHINNNNIQ